MRCLFCGAPLRDFTKVWMVRRGEFACLDHEGCRARREATERERRAALGMDPAREGAA